jgi:hypothetical protein
MKEIIPRLAANLLEVEDSLREYVGMRLLEGAHAEKLIETYRIARHLQQLLLNRERIIREQKILCARRESGEIAT